MASQPDVVADLARLVAFDSVSSRPMRDLAAFVAERCEDLGFRVEWVDDPDHPGKATLLARVGPESEARDGLVISGHLDVVPTEGQPWTSDPFRLTERDGRLYGRGTADMKGFVAATLQALRRVDLSQLRRELVLAWTHDEEVGCLGSAQLAARLVAEGSPVPRACLIGEPTDFRILRMHPGHVGAEIVLSGKAAHSSRPDLGINAIAAAQRVLAAIEEVAHALSQSPADLPELERPWVAVNVATISGGTALNIVPDQCVIRLGYRPLPGMPFDLPFRLIEARLADLPLPGGYRARILRVTPALLTPTGTTLEDDLRPHACHPDCGAATFATDGGNLVRAGMQPLIFGPGSIEVAHQADEYLEIGPLHRAVDVVADVVYARCVAERPAAAR